MLHVGRWLEAREQCRVERSPYGNLMQHRGGEAGLNAFADSHALAIDGHQAHRATFTTCQRREQLPRLTLLKLLTILQVRDVDRYQVALGVSYWSNERGKPSSALTLIEVFGRRMGPQSVTRRQRQK